MTCIAEDRFAELLDGGGLGALRSEERDHLEGCDGCRESWASVAAAADVLTESRPRRAGLAIRLLPVVAAAAMLLAIAGLIVSRESPSGHPVPPKDPVAEFIDAKPEELDKARAALLRMGRPALPRLVAARTRLVRGSPRFEELQDVIWALKVSGAQERGIPEFARRMEVMKIDLSFEKIAMGDLLEFIRDFSGVNFVVDPAVPPGTMDAIKVQDTTLQSVLEIICSAMDLDFDFRYGCVFLSRPMRLWSTEAGVGLPESNRWTKQVLDATGQDLSAKMRKFELTIDIQKSPMTAVAAFVSEVSGVSVQLRNVPEDVLITMKVSYLPLIHAVELLTLPRGWDARIEGKALVITGPGK
jgi:hypothetical protein